MPDVFFRKSYDAKVGDYALSRKHRSVLYETLPLSFLDWRLYPESSRGNLHNRYVGKSTSMRDACRHSHRIFQVHQCGRLPRYVVRTGDTGESTNDTSLSLLADRWKVNRVAFALSTTSFWLYIAPYPWFSGRAPQ